MRERGDVWASMPAQASDAPMDAGARDRRPPEIHFPDVLMMEWKAASGTYYIGARPWSLRIPQPYTQAYGLVTPMAAWVTKMQQAWRSLSLVLIPGRVMDGAQSVVEIADSYNRLRTELQFINIRLRHMSWRSAGICTNAILPGPLYQLDGLHL